MQEKQKPKLKEQHNPVISRPRPSIVAPSKYTPRPRAFAEHRDDGRWSFSFKYYNQKKYFGLNKENAAWFVSLLERLSDLNGHRREDIEKNTILKSDYRYHEINWRGRNVPITRSDLDWLPKDILNNEDDFPIFQFHISKAKGRVAGFWGVGAEASVFYVVLLDPLHNLQPSKYNGYKINVCHPKECLYHSVLARMDSLKKKGCRKPECPIQSEINANPDLVCDDNVVSIYLDDDYRDELLRRLQAKSIKEVLELGIIAGGE